MNYKKYSADDIGKALEIMSSIIEAEKNKNDDEGEGITTQVEPDEFKGGYDSEQRVSDGNYEDEEEDNVIIHNCLEELVEDIIDSLYCDDYRKQNKSYINRFIKELKQAIRIVEKTDGTSLFFVENDEQEMLKGSISKNYKGIIVDFVEEEEESNIIDPFGEDVEHSIRYILQSACSSSTCDEGCRKKENKVEEDEKYYKKELDALYTLCVGVDSALEQGVYTYQTYSEKVFKCLDAICELIPTNKKLNHKELLLVRFFLAHINEFSKQPINDKSDNDLSDRAVELAWNRHMKYTRGK